MRSYKIPIFSPEHSVYVQNCLMLLGYRWFHNTESTYKYTNAKFLFADDDGHITFSDSLQTFIDSDGEWIDIEIPDQPFDPNMKSIHDNYISRLEEIENKINELASMRSNMIEQFESKFSFSNDEGS